MSFTSSCDVKSHQHVVRSSFGSDNNRSLIWFSYIGLFDHCGKRREKIWDMEQERSGVLVGAMMLWYHEKMKHINGGKIACILIIYKVYKESYKETMEIFYSLIMCIITVRIYNQWKLA